MELNTTEEEFLRSNGHSGRLAHQVYLDLKLNKKWKATTLKKTGEICFVEGNTVEESVCWKICLIITADLFSIFTNYQIPKLIKLLYLQELAKHIIPVDNSTPISPKM